MKKKFVVSLIINLLLFFTGGYIIVKKGGFDYLIRKLNPEIIDRKYGVYYETKKSVFEVMPNNVNEIVFLGNSITEYCEWNEFFENANIINRGIRGDIILGVIERLDEVLSSNPKKIFLMLGVNDLSIEHTPEQILRNYEKLITIINKRSPHTRIYVQSLLPTDNRINKRNVHIIAINKGLFGLSKKYKITYVNLFDLFEIGDRLNPIYSFDGLHINGQGYLVWKEAIEGYVNN